MLIRKSSPILPSEITPEVVWRSRREWMVRSAAAAAALGMAGWAQRRAWADEGALP
ncbi:protein-methionine-sulfoxide reductase catalytic subunit MsrP, partial [Bordetella hinzii]|nr:protein-methionine-sulfoxide reductase catalytic subunit MsrP [Bordetella hinzii]